MGTINPNAKATTFGTDAPEIDLTYNNEEWLNFGNFDLKIYILIFCNY